MQEAFNLIKNSSHIVFASHVNPDADTLGSALGLMHALKGTGKKLTVYNQGELPKTLDFMPGFELITDVFPKDADLVVALDCGDIKRLGLGEGAYKIVNIDHHASNPLYGDENIVMPKAASTANVVLDFLRYCQIRPSAESATCLYAALASDTGFFKYESTSEKAFLDAAYLCECGAKADEIARAMTQREPLSKIKLLSKILATLELMAGGKMAYVYLTKQMIEDTGAKQDEADGAVETARSIEGVEVSLFLRELDDGYIRGSLRSKSYIDVNDLAALFGGGGHIRAAGFTIKNELLFADAARKIADTVETHILKG